MLLLTSMNYDQFRRYNFLVRRILVLYQMKWRPYP